MVGLWCLTLHFQQYFSYFVADILFLFDCGPTFLLIEIDIVVVYAFFEADRRMEGLWFLTQLPTIFQL